MAVSNPTAALIIIGNEILSGQTQDLNVNFLAKHLFHLGIEVKEVRMILDVESQIIETVTEVRQGYDFVFITGGIGPTHDDITAESIAKAFNVPLIKDTEALRRLYKKYPQPKAPEALERMACVPLGCELIDNPVSAAPGFRVHNVYVMAGIPSIMQKMFESLKPTLIKGTPRSLIQILVFSAEGVIAKGLREVQETYPSLEIGSYPRWSETEHSVMVVIRGAAGPDLEKARGDLYQLFQQLNIKNQEIHIQHGEGNHA